MLGNANANVTHIHVDTATLWILGSEQYRGVLVGAAVCDRSQRHDVRLLNVLRHVVYVVLLFDARWWCRRARSYAWSKAMSDVVHAVRSMTRKALVGCDWRGQNTCGHLIEARLLGSLRRQVLTVHGHWCVVRDLHVLLLLLLVGRRLHGLLLLCQKSLPLEEVLDGR
jgi:hypothetical protein